MLEDLFYESIFSIQYILGNEIKATTLVDIYAIEFGFIDKKFIVIIDKKLEIESQHFTKPKPP